MCDQFQVVLLPVVSDLEVYKSASDEVKAEIDACVSDARFAGLRPDCTDKEYSLMAAVYNGSIGEYNTKYCFQWVTF